jgi:alcohol dehydrogenase (NADP+)
MGATKFIATDEDKDWAKKNTRTLHLIVSTVSSPNLPLGGYLNLLRVRGAFVQVGAPEDSLPSIRAFSLIGKEATIGGSNIGSPQQVRLF